MTTTRTRAERRTEMRPTASRRRAVTRRAAVGAALAVAVLGAGCTGTLEGADTGDVDTTAVDTAPTIDAGPPATATPPDDAPESAPGEEIAEVIDGDTVELADGTRVRIIGIDTPERGECGHAEATDTLRDLVAGQRVQLRGGAADDSDRYGRLLRYIDIGETDAGLALIESGWARARYDSRDGYGAHLREDAYIAADNITAHRCGIDTPTTTAAAAPPGEGAGAGTDPRYSSCAEAKAAGHGPYGRGRPEYDWYRDGDGDGTVCE